MGISESISSHPQGITEVKSKDIKQPPSTFITRVEIGLTVVIISDTHNDHRYPPKDLLNMGKIM